MPRTESFGTRVVILGMGSVAIQLQKTPTKGYTIRKLEL